MREAHNSTTHKASNTTTPATVAKENKKHTSAPHTASTAERTVGVDGRTTWYARPPTKKDTHNIGRRPIIAQKKKKTFVNADREEKHENIFFEKIARNAINEYLTQSKNTIFRVFYEFTPPKKKKKTKREREMKTIVRFLSHVH